MQEIVTEQATIKEVVTQLPCPVIALDHKFTVIIFNSLAEALFGYSESEVFGRPIEELFPVLSPQLKPSAMSMYTFAEENGRWMGDLALENSSQESKFLRISTSPYVMNGHFQAWLIVAHDQTDWHQAESTVRTTYKTLEEKFKCRNQRITKQNKQLMQISKRLEVQHRLDRAILSVNSKDEIPSAVLQTFLELTDWDSVTVTRINVAEKRATLIGEYPTISHNNHLIKRISLRPYGEKLNLLMQGKPLVIRDIEQYVSQHAFMLPLHADGINTLIVVPLLARGELIGSLNIASTKLVRMRPTILEIIQEVADSLAISLYQARLIEKLKEQSDALQVRNTELAQFAYVASHDLQEPLRSILSFMMLLEQRCGDVLPKEGLEFLEFAISGGQRMKQLIDDLLNYSQLGREHMPFTAVDCNQVLAIVLDNLNVTIQEKQALINFQPLPILQGSESQLIQLFQNLIANGIKFCGEQNPKISLSVYADEGEWVFQISDNGIGIELVNQDEIFKVFRRLHSREAYEGTGIGLAVCKKIIERHNGRLWLRSTPGKGTTFFFTIPQ